MKAWNRFLVIDFSMIERSYIFISDLLY